MTWGNIFCFMVVIPALFLGMLCLLGAAFYIHPLAGAGLTLYLFFFVIKFFIIPWITGEPANQD